MSQDLTAAPPLPGIAQPHRRQAAYPAAAAAEREALASAPAELLGRRP